MVFDYGPKLGENDLSNNPGVKQKKPTLLGPIISLYSTHF
jgi:hypothetical protein